MTRYRSRIFLTAEILAFATAAHVVYFLAARASWTEVTVINPALLVFSVALGVTSLSTRAPILQSTIKSISPEKHLSMRSALFAANQTLLTKYLPGKIWNFIGITETLVEHEFKRAEAWACVIRFQIIIILSALLFSGLCVTVLSITSSTSAFVKDIHEYLPAIYYSIAGITAICVLSIVFYSITASYHGKTVNLLKTASPFSIGLAFMISLLHWILHSFAIWLFISGILGQALDPTLIAVLPGIYAIGFLVVIAPGGLGVREFLLFEYFQISGLTLDQAALASILARLGAVIAEILCVLLLLLLGRKFDSAIT